MNKRHGFKMVEVAVASVLVAVALAASLSMVGATGRAARDLDALGTGQLLADGLMSEILMQSYDDPDGVILFTIEAGESTANRATFDDVDDYHGWSSSPPEAKDGTPIADAQGWTETVSVLRADPAAPGGNRPTESGVKRIVVRLTDGNVTVARTALRTRAWRTLEAQP